MVLQIAVCEDKTEHIDKIVGYIDAISSKYPNFNVKKTIYRSGDELITYYERTGKHGYYDIIFFDIDLGDTDGVEIAIQLRKYDKNVLFIYITDYSKRIADASESTMFRFLTKPVPQSRFNEVFNDAISTINVRNKIFDYTFNYTHYRVFIKDIKYFSKIHPKIYVHTTDDSEEVHGFKGQMGKIYEELKDFGFISIHKSFLVNMAYVKSVKRTHLTLFDGTELSISYANRKDVQQRFMSFKIERCAL